MGTHVGAQHSRCFTAHLSCVRYEVKQSHHASSINHISRQAIKLFLSTADEKFGPITTIRHHGAAVKHIPWTAFQFTEPDWSRVLDARAILEVSGPGIFKCVRN